MSDKKNQPENKVSKASAELINAAKEGENVAPGTQTEPATTEGPKTESTTIPSVPRPDVQPTEPMPNVLTPEQPAAPLTQPTSPIQPAGAPLTKEGESLLSRYDKIAGNFTPPVRQQGRTGNWNIEEINQSAKSIPTEQLRAAKNVIDGELDAREPVKKQQTDTVVGITYDGQTIDAAKGDVKTTFTKAAWDQLPKNKKGWKEVLKTPPEVEALKK